MTHKTVKKITKQFRAFDKKNNRYLDNFLVSMSGNIHECFADSSHSYNRDLSLVKNEPVDAVLEQWTGINDVNGKPIFKNDIIKIKEDWDGYGINAGEIYQVYFAFGGFRCKPKFGKNAKGFWIEDGYDFTVLGNINLNPELLEAKK